MTDNLASARRPARLSLLALLLAAASFACAPRLTPLESANPGTTFAIVGVTVVPMDQEVLVERQTVLVTDGRIDAVGPVDVVEVPQGVEAIDGSGLFVMPGLQDLHVHLDHEEELPMYLASGVTTVLNLHGDDAALARRQALALGDVRGPRLITCAPPLRGGQHDEAEALERIEAAAAAEYDCVKIRGEWEAETYRLLADAATRVDIPFMGHAPRNQPFSLVLEDGRQQIVHLEEVVYTTEELDGWLDRYRNATESAPADNPATMLEEPVLKLARQLAERGIWVVPTQIVIDNYLLRSTDEGLRQLRERPYLRFHNPIYRRAWGRAAQQSRRVRFEQQVRLQHYLLRVFREEGVRIAAGTDASIQDDLNVMPGWSLHEELAILLDAHFSPYEALRTATVDAAAFLGESGEGVVRAGARADLLLLDADPLSDIEAAEEPKVVIREGRWITREQMNADLLAIETSYAALEAQMVQLDSALESDDPVEWLDALGEVENPVPELSRYMEAEINRYGYRLMGEGRTEDAIDVFALNVEQFPQSANTYDSLAEAWLEKGDRERAIGLYREALRVDPDFQNARRMLDEIE